MEVGMQGSLGITNPTTNKIIKVNAMEYNLSQSDKETLIKG